MTNSELIALRKELHRNPEVSGEEHDTAQRIAAALKELKPTELVEGLGGTGIAAHYQGEGNGPTVLVRCELDALPIQEINDFAHRSKVDGVSHKCGHDGHMTMLVGLANDLAERPLKNGKAILLFQPAEENGEGAKAILADERAKHLRPDHVVALHNLPGYPMHRIVCRPGSFTTSVRSIIIELKGRTAHAGEPDKGINPALAIAGILQQALELQVPRSEDGFKQVTPIQIEMGEEAYGISAGEGVVKLTIRTWDDRHMQELVNDLTTLVERIAGEHKLELGIEWTQFFDANQNNERMVKVVERAAKGNGLEYEARDRPFRWGEDFGLFTQRYPGAMFGLGSGVDTPALHNPDYDFPDELIPTGIRMFRSIIDELTQG